jgi:hypothetical protein
VSRLQGLCSCTKFCTDTATAVAELLCSVQHTHSGSAHIDRIHSTFVDQREVELCHCL